MTRSCALVGRIGDTPSMGSGFSCTTWPAPTKHSLLNNLAGTTSDRKARGVAVSGTGNGDFYIRNSATHDVVARMKYLHEDVATASKEVMQYLKTQEGEGGMICIDESGDCRSQADMPVPSVSGDINPWLFFP